ncbi:hypothetical protein KKA14_14570 [bacterium]|nr:hypothetical protein [bacterium]
MIHDLIKNYLSNPSSEDEEFVRDTLRLMEALHRELALFALADWQKLDLFVPELYQTFTSLILPLK